MKLTPTRLALAVLSIAGTVLAGSKVAPVNADKKGLALHGYDPVSYFEQDKPQPGSETFAYTFMGATWRFVSAENRKQFAQNHEMYLPQFGGYCAMGISKGKKFESDPTSWKIVDGKLYVFSSPAASEAADKDPEILARARQQWLTLK